MTRDSLGIDFRLFWQALLEIRLIIGSSTLDEAIHGTLVDNGWT